MNTFSLSLFLLVSALWFYGVKESWISFPKVDWSRSDLQSAVTWVQGAWQESEWAVTWLAREGFDVLGACQKLEEPDTDLYYPDVKHCVTASERLAAISEDVHEVWVGVQRYLSALVPSAESADASLQVLLSLLDSAHVHSSQASAALQDFLAAPLPVVQAFFNSLWTSLLTAAHSVWSQLPPLPQLFSFSENLRITDWVQGYTSHTVIVNQMSLTLVATVVCLTLVYLVCHFLSDTDFSYTSGNVAVSSGSTSSRRQRLAGIRPAEVSRKGTTPRRKRHRQRQKPGSRDASTDRESRPGSESQDHSQQDIDEEALRYIVGGITDTAPETLKERIRTALQVMASHEEEEEEEEDVTTGQKSSGTVGHVTPDNPGVVEYDIRYKDGLPDGVMDVLFCIDPKCRHDHDRYELRGCKILVKPAGLRNGKSGQSSKPNGGMSSRESQEVSQNSSTKEASAKNVNRGMQNYKCPLFQDLGDDVHISKSQNADSEVQDSDSFPDWRAPMFDQNCPYCEEVSEKGTVVGEHKGCPGDAAPAKVTFQEPVAAAARSPDQVLMELLGEAALEEVIGPPQANSSFQVEEKQETTAQQTDNIYFHDPSPVAQSSGSKGRYAYHGDPKSDAMRTGKQSYSYKKCHSQDSQNATALSTHIQHANAKAKCERTPVEIRDDISKENDSVPTFNEAELSLTQELQDSYLSDSQNSMDLAELNRSLSFYGDVSMVELAASWLVRNVLERVGRVLSEVKVERLRESVLNLSSGVVEAWELLE